MSDIFNKRSQNQISLNEKKNKERQYENKRIWSNVISASDLTEWQNNVLFIDILMGLKK